MKEKTLIVVTGATGSGKTDLAIRLACHFQCHIISADSRQIYRDIPIGTCAPTEEQLAAVPHHFVGTLPLDAYYSAACFESDVMALLPKLWEESDVAVMCGGSMMYVDAVTRGIDDLPTISEKVREEVYGIYNRDGVDRIREMLSEMDPEYMSEVDASNPKRLIHAVEIIMESGRKYSELRTGEVKERPFRIVPIVIGMPREELFERINRRVDAMMAAGFEQEARNVYHLRNLNSLNTVGFKEMFAMFDGAMSRETAVARIGKNTRVYAKKQLTWLKKRPEYNVLPAASAFDAALKLI